MDDGKIKEFRKLLTTLEANAEQDQLGERDRLLERNRQVYKFQDLKKEVILPTLRALMVDLDRKGHLTRLWEKTPDNVRFDVQLQTRCLDFHHDKICGNESAFYPPLSCDATAKAAVAVVNRYTGKGFDETWTDRERRGAYVGSFESW